MRVTLLRLIAMLTKRGFKPNYWILDNKCAQIIKTLFHDMTINFQLVSAGTHRRNCAERAIQTYEKHFIAGILGVDLAAQIHLWDNLIPQCDMTLNMLRFPPIHPQISTNDTINGTFNFNSTPLAPVGCKVVVHKKPTKRETWDPAGTNGFYLGPAMQHYRCYSCYVTKTKGIRNCDTVDFAPHQTNAR